MCSGSPGYMNTTLFDFQFPRISDALQDLLG